jgi:hypothetical protein
VLKKFQKSTSILFDVKETPNFVHSDNLRTNNWNNDDTGGIIHYSCPLHICNIVQGISTVSASGDLRSSAEIIVIDLDDDDLFSSPSDESMDESDAFPST